MIVVLCAFLALLAAPTLEQDSVSTPISPCPDVFMYELPRTEPFRWYGVIKLSTDNSLKSIWINIIFNERVELLGNWFGQVTTRDNKNFKIENDKVDIDPGHDLTLRFFIQYKEVPPRLLTIRLNGRNICTPNIGLRSGIDKDTKPVPKLTTNYTFENPDVIVVTALDIFVNMALRTLHIPKSTNPAGIDGKGQHGQRSHKTGRIGRNKRRYFPAVRDNPQCGKLANTTVLNVISKLDTQWPWQIALYKEQDMGNKYACGGTLVTARHVITAAHCVTMKSTTHAVELYTLSIFLGKHNLWASSDKVLIRFVKKIIVNPHYNASTYSHDVAILELHRPVKYTDWVKPACLWPKNDIDLMNIIGKKGMLLSWLFDDEDKVIEDLNQEEVPVVSQATCRKSHEIMERFTSDYTYCAGNRRETSSCASAGSGMVFKLGSTWHLRGLASLAIPGYNGKRCNTTHYFIFTDLAKLLPWINNIVFDF